LTRRRRQLWRQEAIAVMETRFNERELTIEQVAVAVGVSTRTLQNCFEEAGFAFNEKLREVRLRRAADLILQSRRPSEVAKQIGYTHANHLLVPFEAAYGVTPGSLAVAVRARARYERLRVDDPPESRRSLLARERQMAAAAATFGQVQRQLLDFRAAA
jgi:AraC-like DNA-binding protein